MRLLKLTSASLCLALPLVNFAFAESVVIKDWQPWAQLPEAERQRIAPSCPGGYVAVPAPEPIEYSHFQFDQARYDPNSHTELTGDVKVQSAQLTGESDSLRYWQAADKADLQGDVTIRLSEASFSSDSAEISLQNYYTRLKNAEFVLHEQDIRGSASALERTGENQFQAEQIAFTRCVPSSKAWQIKSSTLQIDNDEGVARAWNSRLEVYNVPVLYVPYISFPLNDQPRTGFLLPTFGSSFSQPYYLHLAPNYDDTVTVDYALATGAVMLRNEFRFLTEQHNGINAVDYRLIDGKPVVSENDADAGSGSLNDEPLQNNRWAVSHKQSGRLGKIGYDINTRWVSDRNFDIEYNAKTSVTKNQLADLSLQYNPGTLKNTLSLAYKQPVNDSFTVDNNLFTTLDTKLQSSVSGYKASALWQQQDSYKPSENSATAADYTLIKRPDIQLSRASAALPLGFELVPSVRATRFERDLPQQPIDELSASNFNLATSTQRNLLNAQLSRPSVFGPLQITPSVELWHSQYQLSNPTEFDIEQSDFQQTLWRAAGDLRLPLHYQSTGFGHKVEPRLYYGYAPLQAQDAPLLDTSIKTSLEPFTNSRFSGFDRMGDLSRLSTSVSYSLTRSSDKLKLVNLSLQKAVALEQERMTSTGVDDIDPDWQPQYSDWIAALELKPSTQLSLVATGRLRHELDDWNSYRLKSSYRPSARTFAEVQFERMEPTDDDPTSHRLTGGTQFPVTQTVALIGYLSASTEVSNEALAADAFTVDQMLLGIDIQSCCWALRLAALEMAADDEDSNSLFPVSSERKYYFEVTLRGFGGGFGTIEGILNSLNFGYSGRQFNYR